MRKIKDNIFTWLGVTLVLFDIFPFFTEGDITGGYIVLGIAFILMGHSMALKNKEEKEKRY